MLLKGKDVGYLALGPMAGVTDLPYRLLCRECGADLIYTEMVSANGIHFNSTNTKELLICEPGERPVGIQLFGSEPELMAEAVKRTDADYFDFYDINMGCPVPKVVNNGEGSALMNDPALVERLVAAMTASTDKPVTVKIRKGFTAASVTAVEVARAAQAGGASAIAVHGRTRDQYYSGKADRDIIRKVKEAVSVPVIGNGDITNGQEAAKMILQTGCDAIMVARAAEGNPWIFGRIKSYIEMLGGYDSLKALAGTERAERILSGTDALPEETYLQPDFGEVMSMMKRHSERLSDFKGEYTAVCEMRKHVAWYTMGFPYSAKLRNNINTCTTMDEMFALLSEYGRRLAPNLNF